MSEKRRTGRLGGFELLAQEEADLAYRNVMELKDRPFGDSPIEHLFYAALQTVAQRQHRSITGISPFGKKVLPDGRDYPLESARGAERSFTGGTDQTAFIETQVQLAGWRVDFVIHYPLYRLGRNENGDIRLAHLIVECDGHAFHERTKEQAARDRSRDRLAQYEGLPIFRFTGSEIWNEPVECADEVLAFMERE